AIGETKQISVRRGYVKMLDEVVLARPAPGYAFAAPVLTTISVERKPFDIAVVADGDGVDFFGDQVFVTDLGDGFDDLSAALIAVFVAQLDQVGSNDGQDVALAAQKLLVTLDLSAQLVVFLEDFVALQGRQLLKLQTHDRLGLGLGHAITVQGAQLPLEGGKVIVPQCPAHDGRSHRQVLQALLRFSPARRLPADSDHFIQGGNRDELPFEDVGAPLGFAEKVLGPPADNLHPVPDEFLDHLLEGEGPRPAVHQCQQDDAHRLLQRRKLIELIEDQLRIGFTLDVDDEADRLAPASAALVADRANSLNSLFFDERADGLMQAVPSLLEGHLGDDDLGPAAFLSNVGSRSQDDLASP